MKTKIQSNKPLADTHLVYARDDTPGITRVEYKDGYRYVDPDGRVIVDPEVIDRINALAIPPAYEYVWICPYPNGHIQATARDARGRKQYRYHERWTQTRDADKYQQLAEFALALPRIRRRVARDMKCRTINNEKIVAVVVRLLEMTLMRVGTRAYAKTNKSYGLTTLRRKHASVIGSKVRFQFTGKSGVQHDVTINDRRISRVIKRCMEIPGHELFQYKDAEGNTRRADSGSVNAYLKAAGGGDFTAKHYRTWAASVFAMSQLQRIGYADGPAGRRIVNEVVKKTATLLGNTSAVCRACYIHPSILSAYFSQELPERESVEGPSGLNADERRFLAFLKACGKKGCSRSQN